MKLLLDTHIWIWAIQRPEQLGRRVGREIERQSNDLYLSPISIWEAAHLNRKHRWGLKIAYSAWVNDAIAHFAIREAPFNFATASAAASIQLPQSDAGDVFLAATALTYDLTLVTSDEQLLACRWLKTMSND